MTGAWVERAGCRGVKDQRPWFPPESWAFEGGRDLAPVPDKAAEVCGACQVRSECLLYALENRVLGVWGGTMTHERDVIRRELGIIAAPVVLNRRGARGVLDPVDEPAQWTGEPPEADSALVAAFG